MLCFLLLAKKWPVLMKRWETIENDLPPMRTQKRRRLLWRKVQLITFSVSLLSLSEWKRKTKNLSKLFKNI